MNLNSEAWLAWALKRIQDNPFNLINEPMPWKFRLWLRSKQKTLLDQPQRWCLRLLSLERKTAAICAGMCFTWEMWVKVIRRGQLPVTTFIHRR
jgi:hypothetical protein